MKEGRAYKLLFIAGRDHIRRQKALQDNDNPNSSTIAHQNTMHRERMIEQHFSTGRGKRLLGQQPQITGTIVKKSPHDPTE